jgi:transposase
MWRPFTNSIEQWAPNCRIIYDEFHIRQHANKATDEVLRAEFFRKGGRMRGVVKGQRYEGPMLRYLQNWIRLVPFQNLAFMLLDHLDGILNYCRTKVRFGVVEAINGNIKTLFRFVLQKAA